MKSTYNKLKQDLTYYQSRIDQISDEEFDKTPAEGEWSYAELYAHITSSGYMSLKAAEKCIAKETTESNQKKGFGAIWLLNTGIFPKGRKVPQSIAKSIQKLSKEDAKIKTQKTIDQMEKVFQLLPDAPSNWQFEHPRLGLLNAKDWFRFVQVHTRHHIKQMHKIEALLKKA
jgi:hypothetical protein